MKVTGFAELNGARLYYESQGSGQPLVLVHGFTLDTRMWDDQVAPFSRRYQVIRYDIRGHGRSSLPGRDSYDHIADLKGLLDYLGVEQAHLVGLSWGAAIVTEFALAHPAMASALVVVDPVLWGFPWSVDYGASLNRIWEVGKTEGVEAAKALWLAHPMFAPALEQAAVAGKLLRIVGDYPGWSWQHDDPASYSEPPAAQRLEEITTPTLAVVGERDVPDFHAITGAMSQRIPGARKVVLPGVGHMSNMEDPHGFNEAVLSFLDRLEPEIGWRAGEGDAATTVRATSTT
jgi:3-oxoadipate enol-lactonase